MAVEFWFAIVMAVAFLTVLPLVLMAERIGTRLGLVDRPRRGEVQQFILPRTGGYAVVCAFWAAILVSFALPPAQEVRLHDDNVRLLGVLLGSLALLPLAMIDDARRLGPLPQILGQSFAAIIPVCFGLRMDEVATPFGVLTIPDPLAGPLAAFWVVAMINAINLLDTMDGLASGVAALASGVLFLRSAWFGQASIAVLPAALCGACLGFLSRNWHPSRIILGSSGALFIGYALGVITVIGGVKIGTAFLVLAVPILDVAWVAYRRVSQGRSPVKGGDDEHLPHRLRMLGMGDRSIVLSVYGVCGAIGTAVLLMHSVLPTIEKAYLVAVVVATVLSALAIVARVSSSVRRPLESTKVDQ